MNLGATVVPNVRSDPVVIGAVGGSGTRVFTRLARRAGVFMGSQVNHADDSKPIMAFYDTWLRTLLNGDGEFAGVEWAAAEADFHRSLADHLEGIREAEQLWGAKVPRNIVMLRLWASVFPEFRFVHVVRDGMDMAYSSDRNQLNMIGDLVLSGDEQCQTEPVRAIAYWQRVNVAAAEFGARHLGRRYLRLRFEDLCATPARVCGRLFAFLGVPSDDASVAEAVGDVDPPPSIGRWRTRAAEEAHETMAIARPALMRFGYWDDAAWHDVRRATERHRH